MNQSSGMRRWRLPGHGEVRKIGTRKVGKEDVTVIPTIKDETIRELEFRPLREPYSYMRMTYNETTHEHLYAVIEPRLSSHEQKHLGQITEIMQRTLDYDLNALEEYDIEKYLRSAIKRIRVRHGMRLSKLSMDRIVYYIVRDFTGLGPLQPLMDDAMLEDISCDGPGIPIYVHHRVYGSVRSNVVFEHDRKLDSFVIKLAQQCGKHISISEPMLDATLPDGSRIQTTLSREVTTRGSTFTIRKFREDPPTPADMIANGTMSPEMAAFLWMAVENGFSMLFCGGTASGKTTTMNAASLFIPPQMKVVTLEDTREINLPHENWIAGLTRHGLGGDEQAGSGAIDLYALMTAALRQRPQYMIVGEVRGKETYTLFQAMATGHCTFATMHAESVSAMVHRLENEPINLPRLLLSSLNLVVLQAMVRIGQDTVRRITEVVEIMGIDPRTNEVQLNKAFSWDPSKDEFAFHGQTELFKSLMHSRNLTREQVQEEFNNRIRLLKWLQKQELRTYTEVGELVAGYYKDPKTILKRL